MFLNSRPRRAALFGVALLAARPAAAVAAAATNDAGDIVVTATRADRTAIAEREIARVPGGATVVDAAEFRDKLAVSLRDMLAFAPGVWAQPRYGEEVRLSIRGSGVGRGFHLRGIALLVDGAPINLADGGGDFQEIDPAAIERLDVWRGSNALRFGANGLGGAVNAVTPTGRSAPGSAARLEGGSFGTLRASGSIGVADGPGDAWLGLSYIRDGGYRTQGAQDKLRFNGNVGLRLSDAVATRFYAAVNRIDQQVPGTLTLAAALNDPRAAPPINVANGYARDIRSLRLLNRTVATLGLGELELGGFVNAKALHHPIFQVVDQQSMDVGGFARLTLAGELRGLAVDLALGGTLRGGRTDAKQHVNAGGRRGALTASAEQRAETHDAYGELRVRPADALTLIAGAQWTTGRRRIDNRLNDRADARRSYSEFSPKLGLLWEPRAGVQLYANGSRAAELPTFSELVQGTVLGFVPLDPQRGWTVEAGTRGRAGPVAWEVSAYRADLMGELLAFTVNPQVPASTFNAGRTRHQGIEAGLDVTLARWATLRQVYQLNDFRFRGDAQYGGNRLPVVPPHQYRAELRLGTEALRVTPAVEWVPRGAWADYRNTLRLPGYALLSLGAAARLAGGVTLFADARNLAGKRAVGDVSAAILATPGSAVFYPVEGRAVFGGVRAAF